MSSILIKFTPKKYEHSFWENTLYMSSLSTFWDTKNGFCEQNDICEGICAVTELTNHSPFPTQIRQISASDLRFRILAYQYCNLLCFYRVDIDDTTCMIQYIPEEMNKFGDRVVVIKDIENFLRLVKEAVERENGICCMGDVNYHPVTGLKHPEHFPLVSTVGKDNDGTFPLRLLKRFGKVRNRYGCLDKYEKYADQREWRICYLPKDYDKKERKLYVKGLKDVIEVYDSSEVRDKILALCSKNKPYKFGTASQTELIQDGTVSYAQFKETVESIDGKCQMLLYI